MLKHLTNIFVAMHNAVRGPADPTGSLMPLERSAPVRPNFDGFAKGIDNVRIDVRLSPQFIAKARTVAARSLDQLVGEGRWGGKSPGPSRLDWEHFRDAYGRMIEAAVHRAKAASQPMIIWLVQFAALKFILALVQAELESRRQSMRSSVGSGSRVSDDERVQVTERLSWLARNRARLRYQLANQLLDQIHQVESGSLRALRTSLLGSDSAVPDDIFFNPLLQADSPNDDDVQMKEYVYFGQGNATPYTYTAIEEFIPQLFRRRTPTHEKEIALANAEHACKEADAEVERFRKKQTRAKGPSQDGRLEKLQALAEQAKTKLEQARTAYLENFYAWAEVPANADTLLNHKLFKERLQAARKKNDKELAGKLKAQMGFQRQLLASIEQRFYEKKFLSYVVAAYAIVPLYKDYNWALTAQELFQLMVGKPDMKELLGKVKERRASRKPLGVEPLLKARKQVLGMSRRKQRQYLVDFLKDFLSYRRDLVDYKIAMDAMNRIALQEDPDKLRLSRANRQLNEFLSAQEEGTVAHTLCGHVIIKADVRGSTKIVSLLRERGLNPASHFSLNFFDPIRELLGLYGANIVFIEGDAVILSLFEYQETAGSHVNVARACGLSKELLSIVDRQNVYSRENNLPELELGIGVVFSDEAPSFLYAGESQIMISPAIGKADRYSSCSWLLRKQRVQRSHKRVDVYAVPEGDPLHGEKGEVHLRYNVNGIEIDPPAFGKLQKEIVLQRVSVVIPGDSAPSTFYAGRYPDEKGIIHQVIVREGPIRIFNRTDQAEGTPTDARFYEVVADETVLQMVGQALQGTQPAAAKST